MLADNYKKIQIYQGVWVPAFAPSVKEFDLKVGDYIKSNDPRQDIRSAKRSSINLYKIRAIFGHVMLCDQLDYMHRPMWRTTFLKLEYQSGQFVKVCMGV